MTDGTDNIWGIRQNEDELSRGSPRPVGIGGSAQTPVARSMPLLLLPVLNLKRKRESKVGYVPA